VSANGYLTQADLRPIMGGYFLAPGPAAAWNAMGAEIEREEGIVIRVNGPDSAYRTFARQQFWKDYWCSRGACQNAATPGTSNHGLGWAVDVPDYVSALMVRYGAKYGWRRECSDAPWEGWHWKWCGGWSGKDPGPDGKSGPSYPTLRRGDHGPAVKRAQKHLRRWNLGLDRPTADGSYGEGTGRAVRQFQATHNLKPDGVIGARTWQKLRRKDHFLDDERTWINRVRWARATGGKVIEGELGMVHRNRTKCALRARSIRQVALENGWSDLHRRERFATLREMAGKDLYENTHLPK
jgi:hypothetical protein